MCHLIRFQSLTCRASSSRQAAPHVITAVPLEPATRIIPVQPTFPAPERQGLTCVNSEEIQLEVPSLWRELRPSEPTLRKLAAAVGHLLAAKHAEPEHFRRCQLRLEQRPAPAETLVRRRTTAASCRSRRQSWISSLLPAVTVAAPPACGCHLHIVDEIRVRPSGASRSGFRHGFQGRVSFLADFLVPRRGLGLFQGGGRADLPCSEKERLPNWFTPMPSLGSHPRLPTFPYRSQPLGSGSPRVAGRRASKFLAIPRNSCSFSKPPKWGANSWVALDRPRVMLLIIAFRHHCEPSFF